MTTRKALTILCFAYGVTLLSVSVRAQDAPEPIDPLALKQKMIRDRFQRFEDRVFRLREQLAEIEPENASRLQKALERAGELALTDKLDAVIDLLGDGSSLNNAMDAQRAWIDDVDNLLGILLERDSDNEQRKNEMERLAEYKKSLDRLLAEERAVRDATAQAANAARLLAQIEQSIQRLDAIQKQQGALSEQSKAAKGGESSPSSAEMKEAAPKQDGLAEEAAQLSEDLEHLADLEPEAAADSPAQEKARESAEAASKALAEASKSMSQAGAEMKGGKAQPAGEAQKKSEEALKEARKQLENAKAQLEEQKEQAESADAQRKLSERAQELADKMRQDASSGQSGGKSGKPSKSAQQTPGLQNLDQAQQSMDKASESLDQDEPDDAVPEQEKAIAELEQAQQELEKALSQLRQEERAETLRDLEHRFREMLSKQRGINEGTLTLDRIDTEAFTRVERLQAADLSDQEATLARAAATCLHILEEDATTIVFPRIIGQLSQDMSTVAERLGRFKTGAITQTIEQEIVDTLEQLLDAVQEMQQENEQQSGKSGKQKSKDEEEPLLPASAELKLLRSSQVRVNQRTDVIAEALRTGEEARDSAEGAFRVVARRQEEAADVAREMRDRLP